MVFTRRISDAVFISPLQNKEPTKWDPFILQSILLGKQCSWLRSHDFLGTAAKNPPELSDSDAVAAIHSLSLSAQTFDTTTLSDS